MATYNDTPQATDRISATQDPIRTNFTSVNTVVSENHEAIDVADAGKHIKTDFTNQTGAVPTAGATELLLYNSIPAGGTDRVTLATNELFLAKNGINPWPITGRIAPGGATRPMWSYMPSGLLFKWGEDTSVNASFTLTFPAAANIPVFEASCEQIFITPLNKQATYRITNFAALTVTIEFSTTAVNFRYFAIGL